MLTPKRKKNGLLRNQSGFTLFEILIVVILLGILATIIIPQVSVSTDDAKLNALKTSLSNIRGSVELYYYQHNNQYPGLKSDADGTTDTTDANAHLAFVSQLTTYTDVNGKTANVKDTTFKYGPYLKDGMPTNPFNTLKNVACETAVTDITTKAGGADHGWKFYPKTGVLVAGGGDHDDL